MDPYLGRTGAYWWKASSEPRPLSGRTRERVRGEIRRFYGYREAAVQDARHLTTWLRENTVAQTRNQDQLIEALENECRKRRVEPPTVERLERIARSAVRAYEERFYAQILRAYRPLPAHVSMRCLTLRMSKPRMLANNLKRGSSCRAAIARSKMAGTELQYGKNARVSALAQRIITAQNSEIALLHSRWRFKRSEARRFRSAPHLLLHLHCGSVSVQRF